MHDLLFTNVGDEYPFPHHVHVSWRDGVYEFRLYRPGDDKRGPVLVAADRCWSAKAVTVLNAFLSQLEATQR